MALVDEKYQNNLQAEINAQRERDAINAMYEALENTSPDQLDAKRTALSNVDLRLKEKIIQIDSNEWGQSISYRAADPIVQVAYGFCRIGGLQSFLTADRGESGEFTHQLITFAGHKINDVTDLFLDGQKVTFPASVDGQGRRTFGFSSGDWGGNIVFLSAVSRGEENQSANPDLLAQSNILFPGKWTEAHRQKGQAGVYIILYYLAEKFISGPPEIALEGRWKNDIYDPRTGLSGYTNNAALCLLDYLTNCKYGPKIPLSRFDTENLIEAANICDENVTLKNGGTEKRYTINGAFQVSRGNSHQSVIESMKTAMAGDLVRSGTKFYIYPGKWRAPTVFFSEKHLRSDVRIRAKSPASSLFNAIKGKYRSPETLWELSDYPPTLNSFYEEQDGERIFKEVDLPFTTSPSAAQRICKILLEEHRQAQEAEAEFSLSAFQVRGGDNIGLTLSRLGIESKSYKVTDFDFAPSVSGGPILHCKLTLKETAAAVYDWNEGEETTVDLAPNTNLPNPSILLTPQGVDLGGSFGLRLTSGSDTLYKRSDGTIFTRLKIEWAPSLDPYVLSGGFHEIQIKKSMDSDWISVQIVPGIVSTCWVLDVQDGEHYDVRIRALTSSGKSDFLTRNGFLVLGKLENPTTPTNFEVVPTARGIEISWDPIEDLDVLEYELRSGETWATGTRIYRGDQNSFIWNFQTAGTYRLWLRSKDTSQNYSNDSAFAEVSIIGPNRVRNLSALAIYNMVKLSWSEPTSSSFPIAYYKIYKGSSFASAEYLGDVSATIKTLQEQIAGNYTYWVVPVDHYGNQGPQEGETVQVDAPPLFELLYDQVLNPAFALQLTNAVVEDGSIVAPILTGQTYQNHFTDNSWATPQDQIDAGYPIFIQPANLSNAIYEQVVDYGETIPGALIVVQDNPVWIAGSGTITKTLSYSATLGGWTDSTGADRVYGTNFRYVKIKYEIDGTDDKAVLRLPAPRLRLEVKADEDEGIVSANSADASGTVVTFNKSFLDIFEDKILVSYNGSNPYFASYAVVGNELKVFLWNTSGARVSGNVKWGVKGVLSS